MPGKAPSPSDLLLTAIRELAVEVNDFDVVRRRIVKAATNVIHVVEDIDGPVFKAGILTCSASTDLVRRAQGIGLDVSDEPIAIDEIPSLLSDTAELVALAEFFLARVTEKAA